MFHKNVGQYVQDHLVSQGVDVKLNAMVKQVDESLRVKGTKLGEVFAIGDCAVSGKPPTAQVAYQQGKYLGRMFRAGNTHSISDPAAKPFHYNHQGSMAYIGE